MGQIELSKPYFGRMDGARQEADPILSLNEEFNKDPRNHKINAGIGVIMTDENQLWVPDAVRLASSRTPALTGGYVLPYGSLETGGVPNYMSESVKFLFTKSGDYLLSHNLIASAATVGGTYANALYAELLKETNLGLGRIPMVIMGDPPYPNHRGIFSRRGLKIFMYPEIDDNGKYNLEGTLEALRSPNVPKGSVAVFHGGSHNPTGIGPESGDDWLQIATAAKKKGHRIFIDGPYFGLHKGYPEDTNPVELFLEMGVPLAVSLSYSKISAMYSERTGGLFIPMPTQEQALAVNRAMNAIIRTDISSTPAHGQMLMRELLVDHELRAIWLTNLEKTRQTLINRRRILADSLPQEYRTVVTNGSGLFTRLPLSDNAIEYLKKEHAVYVVSGGRVNIGGVASSNVSRMAEALKDTLQHYPPQRFS